MLWVSTSLHKSMHDLSPDQSLYYLILSKHSASISDFPFFWNFVFILFSRYLVYASLCGLKLPFFVSNGLRMEEFTENNFTMSGNIITVNHINLQNIKNEFHDGIYAKQIKLCIQILCCATSMKRTALRRLRSLAIFSLNNSMAY